MIQVIGIIAPTNRSIVATPSDFGRMGALDELLGELVTEAGVDRGDVLELSLVGNPIMHHLALGLDPSELGTAPFALATTSGAYSGGGFCGRIGR